MNKKQLIIILIIAINLICLNITFAQPDLEVPSGYGRVKFGMSKNQVKQILKEEGKRILGESHEDIYTYGDELFGERIHIYYQFNPFTSECMRISISFPFPSEYDPAKLYMRIGEALTQKYGEFEYMSKDGMFSLWRLGNIHISLSLSSDGKIMLTYEDQDLVGEAEQRQRKIDKEDDKRSKDRL